MRLLRASGIVSVLLISAACDSGMTSPSVPPTVTLRQGDIVYTHPLPIDNVLHYLMIGQGLYSAGGGVFSCGFNFANASSSAAACALNDANVTLNTNTDYWVWVWPLAASSPDDGLEGGTVTIRGQKVTRTMQLFGSSATINSWNAGLFRIIDGNGTIQ